MKPIIGINLDIKDGPPQIAQVQANYYNSVLRAGGVPVLIPPMPDEDLQSLLQQLNGLLLIGGPDDNPEIYGESACAQVSLAAADRESFDLRLVQKAVADADLPILGICAGAQLMNIGLGGSLYQDIPSQFPASKITHASGSSYKLVPDLHEVEISPNSRLSELYDKKFIAVPTSHHQSVKELGKDLQVSARAADGIVEAVEIPGRPFAIGVQWHPERDFEGNKKLFETFVNHAARITAKAR